MVLWPDTTFLKELPGGIELTAEEHVEGNEKLVVSEETLGAISAARTLADRVANLASEKKELEKKAGACKSQIAKLAEGTKAKTELQGELKEIEKNTKEVEKQEKLDKAKALKSPRCSGKNNPREEDRRPTTSRRRTGDQVQRSALEQGPNEDRRHAVQLQKRSELRSLRSDSG